MENEVFYHCFLWKSYMYFYYDASYAWDLLLIQKPNCFAENGRLYLQLHIGLSEKTIVMGEGLGDDLWHSVHLERRGMVVTLGVDDERPLIGIINKSAFAT